MKTTNDELVQTYVSECGEDLAIMERSLIALEVSNTDTDISRLLRAVHSVRTGAGLCGLVKVSRLAERTERTLAQICSDGVPPAPERVTALLRAIDTLRMLLDDPGAGNETDTSEVMAALAGSGSGRDSARARRGPDWQLRTLLVEDDFTSRLVLQTFLSRYGDCHIAVNGREAVNAFRAALEQGQTYGLICMDIMMPEMDGREAVRQIRAMEEEKGIFSTDGAKIIMTTAVNDRKEVMHCFHELCDAYIVKPIDLAHLLGHMKAYDLVA